MFCRRYDPLVTGTWGFYGEYFATYDTLMSPCGKNSPFRLRRLFRYLDSLYEIIALLFNGAILKMQKYYH